MNTTISISGPICIISDLHLSNDKPFTLNVFRSFLQLVIKKSNSLIMLGDIFDFWIGDDIVKFSYPWIDSVINGIRNTAKKIPIWIGRGNRDFLIGNELASILNAKLLPELAILDTDLGYVAVSHGDEFCLQDRSYQYFRSIVRDSEWQKRFLEQSISERLNAAKEFRHKSNQENQKKSNDIMDVSLEAIQSFFENSKANILIHGHTHRPGKHIYKINDRKCERWVLPDWEFDYENIEKGGGIFIENNSIKILQINSRGKLSKINESNFKNKDLSTTSSSCYRSV
ncbi:MAG: UDP-2,3-diacylglucosamine diphosphatase [Bordetella sp.]|nr:MAG: UDP-2,3-diacylglucosamine diphosphatase [Bordetella sp.]